MKIFGVALWIWGIGALVGVSALAAVTWDQFQRAKSDKTKVEDALKLTQDDLAKTQSALKKAQDGKQEWMDRWTDLAEKSKKAMDAQQNLVSLLQQKIVTLEAGARAQAEQSVSAYPATSSAPAKVSIPRWMPDPPPVVARKIKERATREHGNNFSAAKYEIEWQTEAHEKLLRYYKMNNVTVNDVLAKAALEKGDDFQGMVWEVERQLEAAKIIQSR